MKIYCLILLLFCSVSSFGQIDDSDIKKIEKILVGTELLNTNTTIKIIDSSYFKGYYDGQQFSTRPTSKPDLVYVSKKPVSLYQYEQFRKQVIDSVIRDRVYFCLEGDEEASLLLQFEDYFFNEENLEMQDFDPSQRKNNRAYFPLDFSRRIKYDDLSIQPCLGHFYIPEIKKYYRSRTLNDKLFNYRYYTIETEWSEDQKWKRKIIDDSSSIQYDLTTWSLQSSHPYDAYAVFVQLYPRMYEFNVPATGLSLHQAEAFAFWKAEQIRMNFSKKGLDCELEVRVSAYSDFQHKDLCKAELPIPVKDKTPDWLISKEKYIQFWQHLSDSILRECLYQEVIQDEHALTLLNYENFFLDEVALEFVEMDPSDRRFNRNYFPFNYSVKTRKYKNDVSCHTCFDSLNRTKELNFKYFYCNSKERDPKTNQMKIESQQVIMPHPNGLICKSTDESITHYLSYEQALAFYNWKYPIWKFNSSSKWTDYVFPSESEFEKVKTGESVYLPFENIPFPSPLFYYTVRVYE